MERLWTRPFIQLTLTLFFLFVGFYLLLPTLPVFIKELGASEIQVGMIIGMFTISAVLFRPLVGGWLDRYGRRRFIIAGLILFVCSMFLYHWVSGLILLFLLRIFHGFSWAFSTTSIGTAITDMIPASRRAEGMGWYGISTTLAMAMGPMIGVWMINHYSFQHLFFLGGTLALVAFLLASFTNIREPQPKKTDKMEIFDRSVVSISIAVFFLAFTYGGITTFLPLFADDLGLNSGTFFLVYALVITLIRPVSGKLADRYGESRVMIPSILITVCSLVVLSFSYGFIGMILSAVLYGIGFGSAHPAMQAVTLRLAPAHKRGVANASFFTAFDLGIGLGAMILGFVSEYTGYRILFDVCAVFGLVSLIVFAGWVRRQLRNA